MVGTRQFSEPEAIKLALELFWQKGLRGTTMQDLAAATGVQRGSLYNAYGNKEAIFLLAFDLYANEFLEMMSATLAQGDVASRLTDFFDLIIVNMTSGSPQRGCLTTRTILDADMTESAIIARTQDALQQLELVISKAIVSASETPPADAKMMARAIVTFTRGLAVMQRAGYSRKQLKDIAKTFSDAILKIS